MEGNVSFCIVWGTTNKNREMDQEHVSEPKDQHTLHICDGPHVSHCGRHVYRPLPYIRQVGSDAKICPTCRDRYKKLQKRLQPKRFKSSKSGK